MSIRRGPISRVDNFTIVPNEWLRDARLSRRARGLLAELMSHAPGWETSVEALVAGGPEGRDAIRSALAELAALGYLVRSEKRARDEAGHLGKYDYMITDPAENPQSDGEDAQVDEEPASDSPTSDFPTLADPTSGNPPPKKNITKKTISKNTSPTADAVDAAFDAFWKAYPRKVGKDAAKRAFRLAVRRAKSPVPILEGLARFEFQSETQYQPHPSTWLNGGRWADEPGVTPKAPRKRNPWEL